MTIFLRESGTLQADIIAIQKSWSNFYQNTIHHSVKATHQLLYSKENEIRNWAQVCLYVSKWIASWQHAAHSCDYQILAMKYCQSPETAKQTLYIHNIYNQKDTDMLQLLKATLWQNRCNITDHIIVDDMNLHHSVWSGHEIETEQKTDEFIKLTNELGLELLTEPRTVIWQREDWNSTINLIFVSQALVDRLMACEIAKNITDDSDHYSIRTLMNISTAAKNSSKRWNWRLINVKKLVKFI